MDQPGLFLLKWKSFQENIASSYKALRNGDYFADVTLACEDGRHVEAHKVVLSASSSFFFNILQRNKHSHPLIYMRGISSNQIFSILDYIYKGETSIAQDHIQDFLAIAKELKLIGLEAYEKTTPHVLQLDDTKTQESFKIIPPKDINTEEYDINFKCNICRKYLKSKDSLRHHKNKSHKQLQHINSEDLESEIHPENTEEYTEENTEENTEEEKINMGNIMYIVNRDDNILEDSGFKISSKTPISSEHDNKIIPLKLDIEYFEENTSPKVAKKPKKRSYADKCVIQWNEGWMQEYDHNMDKFTMWAERRNEKEADCNWCSVTFKYNSLGICAFKQHSKTKIHKIHADEKL